MSPDSSLRNLRFFFLIFFWSLYLFAGNQRGIWYSQLQCVLKMSTSLRSKVIFDAYTYSQKHNNILIQLSNYTCACKDTQTHTDF